MKKIISKLLIISLMSLTFVYADSDDDDDDYKEQESSESSEKSEISTPVIPTTTTSLASKNDIVKVYVATFGRAPDSKGLDYWEDSSNLDIQGIAKSFFDQPETQKVYPPNTTSSDFVSSVYNNLFNRTPDSKGLDYWIKELDSGSIEKNLFLLAVINGAQNTSVGNDATLLLNKTTVGLYFADNGLDNVDEAKKIMSSITDDSKTVESAKVEINKQAPNTPITTNTSGYMLTAWNDLGMHCMDGKDFSVFSVLPPYNNLHAQLKEKNGDLITSGVTITYEATRGTDGKLNSNSLDATNGAYKTNFWNYAKNLFGVTLNPNVGLTGNPTPSKTPAPMKFNATHQWWEAEGLPITPYNDDGTKNYYPMVKVTAKDSSGKVLTSVNTVLPVSDEMDCKRCHASSSGDNAKPTKGWVNNSDAEKDYKFNILRLHDQENPSAVQSNITALKAKGYNYDVNGLEATANGGTAILCTACHKSNALPNVGIGLKQFTSAIHSVHSKVKDPLTGLKLGDSTNRSACYACHPGADTKCLRGAMGDAKNSSGANEMQCQSCHGNMANVGDSTRDGWLDEPNCQACHQNGKRELSAIDPQTNTLRKALDTKFATNPNTPSQGKSLFRFSKGHGKLQCEACHGSTHAIFPAHQADNMLSQTIQGHSGTLSECSACHSSVPNTVTGGPHGMHPVGSSWVKTHQDVAEHSGSAQCAVCHGADFRGGNLSEMFTDRVLDGKNFPKGKKVSCYDCHNGPSGEDD